MSPFCALHVSEKYSMVGVEVVGIRQRPAASYTTVRQSFQKICQRVAIDGL